MEISRKNLGVAVVTDPAGQLAGIFTDGDLRRTIDLDLDLRTVVIDDVMTCGGQHIQSHELAATAVNIMQEFKISVLPVMDNDKVCGVIHMHMLLAAGVV